MTFEGEQKILPIKGIMRTGADSICEDGSMNEVIGLEYKDGSYVPYAGEVTSTAQSTNDDLRILVHKTSTQTNIVRLRVYEDTVTSGTYIAKIDWKTGNGAWTDIFSKSFSGTGAQANAKAYVVDMAILGNTINVSTKDEVRSYLFKNGGYVYIDNSITNRIKIEVVNTLCGKSKFTTEIGSGNEYLNNRRGVYFLQESKEEEMSSRKIPFELMKTLRGYAEQEGGITGAFYLTTCFRTKSGRYISFSPFQYFNYPLLVCDNDKYLSNNGNVASDFGKSVMFLLEGNYENSEYTEPLLQWSHNGIDEIETDWSAGGHIFIDRYNVGSNKKRYCGVVDTKYNQSTETWNTPIQSATRFPQRCFITWKDVSTNDTHKYTYESFAITYGIRFSLPEEQGIINEEIDSVCIFMSEQIYPNALKDENEMEYVGYCLNAQDSYGTRNYRTYIPALKSKDNIEKELSGINNMYLIKEEKISQINYNTTYYLDLRGKLGGNMSDLEKISISDIENIMFNDSLLSVYNSKLHVYDYIKYIDNHIELKDLLYTSSDAIIGQPSSSQFNLTNNQYGCIELDVNYNIDGIKSTKTYYNGTMYFGTEGEYYMYNSIKPIITLAGSNIESIIIRIGYAEYNGTQLQSRYLLSKTFKMIKNTNLNVCYCITNNYYPNVFPVNSMTSATTFPVLQDDFLETRLKNVIRVSDISNPTYFPAKNTYTIGNGKILGLASLSVALSQDTFGRYPLLVFCTDGIWSLGVDETGATVYTVATPFSREVCVNRNSICQLDGAVLFASSKGLMVATQEGVQPFNPNLNGEPRHLPQDDDSYGRGLKLYKDCINNAQVVQLTNAISEDDFIDYLHDTDTYISYVAVKNKVIVYNKNNDFCYWIDIPTRNVTKLNYCIKFDNNNYPEEEYYLSDNKGLKFEYLSYESQTGTQVPSMFQTRPIKLTQASKTNYRVLLRGYFKNNNLVGTNSKYAELLVLGSLDGDNWQPIGLTGKKLLGGFHDLGCVTERVSFKYMMIIFSGSLDNDSHIDSIEVTINTKYNDKLK